jgi:broad specificity phosphatase PhoE
VVCDDARVASEATVTVHLLRHGEVHNPDHVLYGRLPGFRLSELGQRQAGVAAEYLATRPVGHLVSSPLERAQQTAAPLARLTGLTPVLDERLIEAANELEGRVITGGGDLVRRAADLKLFRNPFRPSWGEPYAEIAARMLAAARAARDAALAAGDGREAVCVSHQLPIVIARRAAEHQRLFHDPRRRQCGLASVTSLVFDGDDVVEVRYVEPAATLPAGEGAGA